MLALAAIVVALSAAGIAYVKRAYRSTPAIAAGPVSQPADNDPMLLAALTHGGPPLPSSPPPQYAQPRAAVMEPASGAAGIPTAGSEMTPDQLDAAGRPAVPMIANESAPSVAVEHSLPAQSSAA